MKLNALLVAQLALLMVKLVVLHRIRTFVLIRCNRYIQSIEVLILSLVYAFKGEMLLLGSGFKYSF